MFCPQPLAAAIDRAEGSMCASVARPHGASVLTTPVAGGVAVFAGATSPVNKLIGAGFEATLDLSALDAVEAHFTVHGARLQAEVATLADPELHGRLAARGYAPSGFENVLGHGLHKIAAAPAGVTVTPATAADLPLLADTVAQAFAHPDAGGVGGDQLPPIDEIRKWFFATMRVDGFAGYLARIGNAVAGGGVVRLAGSIAQFGGAGTLPAFRRRGVQTALLRARLRDAAARGCEVAVIVTQPASKSQQNAQREGFALLYARQLLVRGAGVG